MSVTPITSNGSSVQSAIARAAQKTGIDFQYLLGQAQVESGLRADARAATSSASGLYQFIDQSWLSVVKKHGAENGLSWAADAIQSSGGRLSVADPQARSAILALRNDPDVASMMAAEHAADNKSALEDTLGRTATGTDLYMAHFLGLGGARSFLSAMQSDGGQAGADMFPAAARANRGVFYASDGSPRSLTDIYGRFAARLGAGADAGATNAASYATGMPDHITSIVDGGATIVPGSGDTTGNATQWARAMLAQLDGGGRTTASLMRPTPATAELAYMMLSNMGAS